MKIEEVRIGNYYQDKHGNIEQISQIDKIGVLRRINDQDEDWALPIPLNLKQFEKLGFKNDHSTYEYVDGCRLGDVFIAWNQWTGDRYEFSFSNGEKRYRVGLNYVHQLQNLFFTLTGQELNYKP